MILRGRPSFQTGTPRSPGYAGHPAIAHQVVSLPTGPGNGYKGTAAILVPMSLATINGTLSDTVKNAARCPDWTGCSDLPKARRPRRRRSQESQPPVPAAFQPATREPPRCPRQATTRATLVTSMARVTTIPLTGTDCAASIASFPVAAASD